MSAPLSRPKRVADQIAEIAAPSGRAKRCVTRNELLCRGTRSVVGSAAEREVGLREVDVAIGIVFLRRVRGGGVVAAAPDASARRVACRPARYADAAKSRSSIRPRHGRHASTAHSDVPL